METPRVLMLVLANDDGGLYSDLQNVWRQYMNSSEHIDCYFIKGRLEQEEQFVLDENALYIKTQEGYVNNDALWQKTLKAVTYFQNSLDKYDFVYRTNLSSFIRFDKYLEYCKTLPKNQLCSAVIGMYGVLFPSGSGFTLSCDLVRSLIDDPPEHTLMDDITMGVAMTNWGIRIVPADRADIMSEMDIHKLDTTDPSIFHYRIKMASEDRRTVDIGIHNTLIKKYVPAPKTTVVTMFFDLTMLPDASSQLRDKTFYLKNARSTLHIQAPMIIFCDSSTRAELQRIREEIKAETVYVERNITDYDFYKMNLDIIKRNREGQPEYIGSRNTPSYYLLTLFKFIALKIAKERSDFATSHYAWIDIGCRHVFRGPMHKAAFQMCMNPSPRVSATYIHYRAANELNDMKSFVYNGPCGIAAGIITVEGTYLDRLYSAIFSIFYEMLYNRCGHSEETILTYCYNRYPELFTLKYGDYYSLLSNYTYVTADYHSIRWFFIQKAIDARRLDLAVAAAKKVLESVETKRLVMHDYEEAFLRTLI